ncbi:hypothetical protein JCM3765_005834 [Sporobolomyces pararoseus]
MAVWLCSVMFMSDLEEFAPEQFRLAQKFVRQGLDYLPVFAGPEHSKEDFVQSLGQLVRGELRFALLLDQPSKVTPAEFVGLLGSQSPPLISPIPEDLSFVFSAPPEPPEVRKAAFDFQRIWTTIPIDVFDHLDYVLTYAPSSKLSTTIEYCWSRLDEVTACVQACCKQILLDTRYNSKRIVPRPASCLNKLIFAEFDALMTLRSIHNKIAHLSSSTELVNKSKLRWYKALERTVQHLQLIPREEIHSSLLLGKMSSVSPSEYSTLFELTKPPSIPTIPSDLSFVFSGHPEPAEVRKAAFDFQQRWTYLAHPIYYYLEYLLAYAHSSDLLSTIECCWRILDQLTSCLQTCFNRIVSDPRYDSNDGRIRPGRCLNNITHVEHGALFILTACHEALYRTGIPSVQTLDNSHRFWFKALSRTAHRLIILPQCTRESFELYSTCASLVEGLRHCPEGVLKLWATRHHRDSENYGMPDAGRTIAQLEACRLQEDW